MTDLGLSYNRNGHMAGWKEGYMNAIRYFREKESMSQKELADAVGLQPTSISRYERGVRQLSVDKAKKIADILKVDWTCLYDDAGDGSGEME